MRVDLTLRTPHGEPVRGARVLADGVEAVEGAPGCYAVEVPCELVVEPAGPIELRSFRCTLSSGDTAERVVEYAWFTPIGYPPTSGNAVELLVDGETAWSRVAEAIRGAKKSVHVTTWMYQPTIELERFGPVADPDQRVEHTAGKMLARAAERGVCVRLLAWDAPVLTLDRDAREAAEKPDDNFEILEQTNPTAISVFPKSAVLLNAIFGRFKIGSYHQKSAIIDGRIGFCGGMNLKENDWDSRAHLPDDARRCSFQRDADERREVLLGLRAPDHRPRHDVAARVEGPAVQHLEQNFEQRWNHLISTSKRAAKRATAVSPPLPRPPVPRATSQVQVVRTMPKPFAERGILDVYLRAVENARRLVYIEDQYFRSTRLADALARAMRAHPSLEVIVVTQQAQAEDFLAGGWTRLCFDKLARTRTWFQLYTLKVASWSELGELVIQEVDNHAKLMIVDDVFLTVGSCNTNDRGFEYEGELNLAIVDPPKVHAWRADLFREHLRHDPALTGDLAADLAVWRAHAEHNARAEQDGHLLPKSHLFPFSPRPFQPRLVTKHVT